MLGPPVCLARSHFVRIALLRLGCLSSSLWLCSCPCQPFHGLRQLARIGVFNNVVHSCASELLPIGNRKQDIHQDRSQGQQFRNNGFLRGTRLGCLQQSI